MMSSDSHTPLQSILENVVEQRSATPFAIATLAIVGLGLIGGSLALALKKAGCVQRILGVDKAVEVGEQALALGIVDAVVTVEEAAAQADVMVMCVPVAKIVQLLEQCAAHLRPHTLVSDVGSTKLDIIQGVKQVLGERAVQFIPAHPIAGSEQHGLHAAMAHLFTDKKVVLCPLSENRSEDVLLIEAMWQSTGAHCYRLAALQHDAVFATVSHLPHLLAYALMAQVMNAEDAQIKLDFAGSGFRDFTRIAASSAEVWRDICLSNRTALLQEIAHYQGILEKLKFMIENNQAEALTRVFSRAAAIRANWSPESMGTMISSEK